MKAVVQSVTANYGALVIHTSARSGKFEEMCYHARIPAHEVNKVHRLGKMEQWNYSDQFYFDQNSRVDLCHAREPWKPAWDKDDEGSGEDNEQSALEVHHVQCAKRTVTVRMMPKLKVKSPPEQEMHHYPAAPAWRRGGELFLP